MKEEIEKAIEVLSRGGVIIYPTDTIWGIGCDATNAEAVRRVYEIKGRAESKALIVLTDSMAKVQGYVQEVPDVAWDLVEVSDKPLTIVYPGAKQLADNLVSEDGSIAIRVTQEAFSKRLCEQFRRPIVSTSANKSGEPAASRFSEISDDILSAVDYVVEYRQEEVEAGRASSIIKLGIHGEIEIIRA